MKRLFPLAIVALFFLASCEKRDYYCTCKMNHGPTQVFMLGRMPNETAQKKCNDYEQSLIDMPTGTIAQCKVTY